MDNERDNLSLQTERREPDGQTDSGSPADFHTHFLLISSTRRLQMANGRITCSMVGPESPQGHMYPHEKRDLFSFAPITLGLTPPPACSFFLFRDIADRLVQS